MFPSVMTDAERNSVITLSGCCAKTVRTGSETNRINVKSFLIRRNVFGMFYFFKCKYLGINKQQIAGIFRGILKVADLLLDEPRDQFNIFSRDNSLRILSEHHHRFSHLFYYASGTLYIILLCKTH